MKAKPLFISSCLALGTASVGAGASYYALVYTSIDKTGKRFENSLDDILCDENFSDDMKLKAKKIIKNMKEKLQKIKTENVEGQGDKGKEYLLTVDEDFDIECYFGEGDKLIENFENDKSTEKQPKKKSR